MAERGVDGPPRPRTGETPVPPAPPALPGVRLLLTCEHGGRRIPAAHRSLFRGAGGILRSHRGWDPGALPLARRLARATSAPLIASTTTRLLVELNRSVGHPDLFSEFTRELPLRAREELLAVHYRPYRESVEQAVRAAAESGRRALHLSIHSFTPRLAGVPPREVEVGLLFDPARQGERELCAWWVDRLRGRGLDARANEPYLGTDDGLTTALRAIFPDGAYAGVELEARSDLLAGRAGRRIGAGLAGDLRALLGGAPGAGESPRR